MIMIESENLFEMATVHRDFKYDVSLEVNPDSNRVGNPYFKFYNNSNYMHATSVIRILFGSPSYTHHKKGKPLWEIDARDKKILVQLLKESYQKDNSIGCTV